MVDESVRRVNNAECGRVKIRRLVEAIRDRRRRRFSFPFLFSGTAISDRAPPGPLLLSHELGLSLGIIGLPGLTSLSKSLTGLYPCFLSDRLRSRRSLMIFCDLWLTIGTLLCGLAASLWQVVHSRTDKTVTKGYITRSERDGRQAQHSVNPVLHAREKANRPGIHFGLPGQAGQELPDRGGQRLLPHGPSRAESSPRPTAHHATRQPGNRPSTDRRDRSPDDQVMWQCD